ncbi:unnamed protein product [Meloidogyne enterolobii]|uniref:Uncharacterized protein n=2 Tax=Meloidogyne enterolobii TaxID=390850 RepID=A0A6V7V230_MELEN|nr:unnamed protein product [Meloidogyne enterolobii]
MGLFGKVKVDPKEQVRALQRKLRLEISHLNRQINAIQREEEKVKREIKVAAKKGDRDVCVVLAKSIVHSKKSVAKLHATSAQINSIIMNMQHQLATIRMAGTLKQSTEVMRAMQQLVKVPEVMQIMREMAKEMTKMGLIEEIIEETMESFEPENMEELAQEEVDKVLWEVTAGELGKAPAAVSDTLEQQKEERAKAIATADEFIASQASHT